MTAKVSLIKHCGSGDNVWSKPQHSWNSGGVHPFIGGDNDGCLQFPDVTVQEVYIFGTCITNGM
jgi:hypothetical protein